jgi:hypothetical protein
MSQQQTDVATLTEHTIRHDLDGASYIELINYAFQVGKRGYFVLQEQMPVGDSAHVLVRSLQPYLLLSQKVKEWPGTKLLDDCPRATMYTFEAVEPARKLLLRSTDHLYGWTQPDLPEDIGFLDGRGVPLVESTIHEKYLLLRLDDLRSQLIKRKFPALHNSLVASKQKTDAMLAQDWVKHNCLPEEEMEASPYLWASDRLYSLVHDEPELAWAIIRQIPQIDSSDWVLANVAAGPLERLLVCYGVQFIERIEMLAAQDPTFRKMLSAVWKNNISDDVWRRLKAVAGPSF